MWNHEHGSAILNEWLERQKAVFEALAPKLASVEGGDRSEELWRSYMSFWATLARAVPPQAGAIGTALETLVEPAAGQPTTRGPQDMISRLARGPALATLWDWDQRSIKAYDAWLELQQAVMAHQAVLDRAWAEATRQFVEEVSRPPTDDKPSVRSWRAGLELWLATVNQALLEAQRSEEFLQAQRRLLRAAMEYRLRLGEIAEELCELFQVPGRKEVDELARMVHELRREVRVLTRRRNRGESPESTASTGSR